MSKKLYLVRHAQTEYSNSPDYQRKLTEKGITDARKVGKWFAKEQVSIQHIVSSAATRANTTSRLIAEQNHFPASHVELREEHYQTTPQELLNFVNTFDDRFDIVILVNHNPTLTHFLELLTGNISPIFEPASLAEVEFEEESWTHIVEGCGKLIRYIKPDDIS